MSEAEIRSTAYALLEAGETLEAAGSSMRLTDQLKVCALLKTITGSDDWRPDIVGGLTAEVEQRESAGVDVRHIELSPRLWGWFMRALPPSDVLSVLAAGMFMGVPIRRRGASVFYCQGCGAPHQANSDACSYCKRPRDVITINGEDVL